MPFVSKWERLLDVGQERGDQQSRGEGLYPTPEHVWMKQAEYALFGEEMAHLLLKGLRPDSNSVLVEVAQQALEVNTVLYELCKQEVPLSTRLDAPEVEEGREYGELPDSA